MTAVCPCGSGKKYSECCKGLHEGSYPENALALMRSRYTAYAYHLADYIIRTTHPENPNYKKNHRQWVQEILHFSKNTQFERLEILEFVDGADKAYVTFNAHLNQHGLKQQLIEKSYFEKVGDQWLYRDAASLRVKPD